MVEKIYVAYALGDLSVLSEKVVIAGLSSNLTVTGCLTIMGESTLILQLLEEDTITVTSFHLLVSNRKLA